MSIVAAKELLQAWDTKFLISAYTGITLPEYVRASLQELGDGWLLDGSSSSMDFKNQLGQPFFLCHMAYRYIVFKSLPKCFSVHSKCFSQALNWWEEAWHISKKPASTLYTDVRPLSPTGSVDNVEIVIGDYFQLSKNMSQESSMFHRWMRGLGMNNTFSINLTFFDLPDGLPPLQGDTPSWNILRPDHISQAVDVASKVLQYEGIMLVILPCSLFWGGLLAMMAENDDSRLVEFPSGCLLSNIPVETKGAGFGSMVLAAKEIGRAVFALEKESAFEGVLGTFHKRWINDVGYILPCYAEAMAQAHIEQEPIVREHNTIQTPPFMDVDAEED
ncbi:hypothetical protein SELMODRAFT_428155 [Selaginella moellendorffii]|uniref:Uncharacterized protein n=1 Tax=Selaginella moellendorffii TaxID=88036 RepID=D8T1X7_SELML|nr:hypothetical protein SELMODRAFT_428155 [Selaginella moellendorffii]